MDVWTQLLTKDYVDEAELIVAAGMSAEKNPQVLLGELTRQSEKLIELQDDAKAIADRWVRLVAALSALTLTSVGWVAATVAQVQDDLDDDEEPDQEKVRQAAVQILANCAASVREHLDENEGPAAT